MKFLSQLSSWVFLPLFMPVYALVIVFYVPSHEDFLFEQNNMFFMNEQNKGIVLFEYAFLGMLLPAISLIIMRASGMLSDIEIGNRSERKIPIIVTIAYCVMLYVLLVKQFAEIPAPKYVFSLALSGLIVSVVHFVFNLWKKISIHAGGAGIMFGFLLAYALGQDVFELWTIVLPIIASGIVMTARLYLKKHTMSEIVIGWFVGFIITFTVNYMY